MRVDARHLPPPVPPVSAPPTSPVRPRPARAAVTRRAIPDTPRPWIVTVAGCVIGLGLGAVIGSTLTSVTASQLRAPGGPATFVGSLTGMVGTYLAMVMVLLASRIPAIERVLGQDGLLRWHRRLGPWPLTLIVVHAVALTVGYAQAARTGIWHEIGTLISSYPDILAATVGLGLMILAGVVSIRALRTRIRRETWWNIHLYMYMALALSFAHVLALGPSFVGHPLTRTLWSLAWAATVGVVLAFRIGLPVVRSMRHRLRVVEVRNEAPGIISVICAGRNLERLKVAGGQFVLWRFLAKDMWWQAHPYSLSALPHPPVLRLTVKNVGDHSAALAQLKPGTRVLIEGPYGAFTRQAGHRRTALLVAGGIGVTALRSLLEDLPRSSAPVIILRASRFEDLALRDEIVALAERRDGRVHELVGTRSQHLLDAASLRKLVPDVTRRDLYVCGPEEFVTSLVATARGMGITEEAIHYEAFSL